MGRVPKTPPSSDTNFSSPAWQGFFRDLLNWVTVAGSIAWGLVNKTGSNLIDIQTRNHNDLQNIQGGSSNQRYHLTNDQHNLIPSGTPVAGQVPVATSATTSQWGTAQSPVVAVQMEDPVYNEDIFILQSINGGGEAGPQGEQGEQGVMGPPGPQGISGEDGLQGPPGSTGVQGIPGIMGPTGFDGIDGEDGFTIQGPKGDTGAKGDKGDTGNPGADGTNGTNGTNGINGVTIPGVDGVDGEDGFTIKGERGCAGPTGPSICLDGNDGDDGVSVLVKPDKGLLDFAGGLTSVTTINATVTPTTGGITLPDQVATVGSVWRISASGQVVAVSDATARNIGLAPYWGSTKLTAIEVGMKISVAQTTAWQCEFILSVIDTTHIWTIGWIQNKVKFPAIAAGTTAYQELNMITSPASTAVTAGFQTLDLRFYFTVAITNESWKVFQVTLERLK